MALAQRKYGLRSYIQGVSQLTSNIPEIGLGDQNKCAIPIKVDGCLKMYIIIFHLTVCINFINYNL